MPAYRPRTWWGVAVAALVAAACKDTTSPRLSDPAGLTNDVQTLGSVFTTALFQSYQAVSDSIGAMAPSLRFGGELLQATSPTTPAEVGRVYSASPQRAQALKQLAIGLAGTGTSSVIPDTLWNSIFAWDPNTHHYYRQSTTGGPDHGVRFLLYAIDPITHQIVESPLTVIGYVDLIDVSQDPTVGLRVVLVDTPPGSAPDTLADYTITATQYSAGSFSATAVGFVIDGTHTLTFNVSFSVTNADTAYPDVSINVHWALNTPAVTVDLTESITMPDADHEMLSFNLSITRGAETVAATGTITVTLSTQSVTVNITITVNGAVYARITGTDNGITIRHADGSQLSQEEFAALEQLFSLPDTALEVIQQLFHPAENLLGV